MLLLTLYIIGITAEAMTGALAAGRNRLDLFGVIIIAVITAIGGGTIRDIVLGHYPVGWVKEPNYFLICAGAAIITVIIAPLLRYFKKIFLILDAMGLMVFTIIGVQVAYDMGYGLLICCLSAVLTGVSGGVVRDMLTGRIPLVFQKELYASVSFVAAAVYYYLLIWGPKWNLNYEFIVLSTIGIGFTIRVLAIYLNLSLPVFDYQEGNEKWPQIPIPRSWKMDWGSKKSASGTDPAPEIPTEIQKEPIENNKVEEQSLTPEDKLNPTSSGETDTSTPAVNNLNKTPAATTEVKNDK